MWLLCSWVYSQKQILHNSSSSLRWAGVPLTNSLAKCTGNGKENFGFFFLLNCYFSIFGAYFSKLWPLDFVKILFFSEYNLNNIWVSLEISLLLSFYLLCFPFILHLSYIILTLIILRRVMRWELQVMIQIDSTILRIFTFF